MAMDQAAKCTIISVLQETGDLDSALAAARVSRISFAGYVRTDPILEEAVFQAKRQFLDKLEREAVRRAVEGWREKRMSAKGDEYEVVRYSDALLTLLLKGNAKDKYSEKSLIDQTVTQKEQSTKVDWSRLTPEEQDSLRNILEKLAPDSDIDDEEQ
jgi:hypothetical protein